jgi:UDP:flavonoid glycosyltransferase YjiC (YdhE family)
VATILCVTSGLPSVVYGSVELARRLAAAGHRVIYAGLPDARQLAEHHRLEFVPLAPSRYAEFLAADASRGPLDRLSSLRRRRERATSALAVDAFARAVRDAGADLVLVNGEMHEHVIAAVGAGAPVALLNTFVSIWRRPGLPPPHCLVRPGVGWRGSRAGIALLWLALRLRKRLRAWSHRCRRLGCDRLAILRSLARQSGFDFRRETDDGQWLRPFTYRRLPVLSLHAAEFELPHRAPEQVVYVGPMVLESRIDRPLPSRERQRLQTILARCRRGGGERTLIYAGFGTVLSADVELLRRLLGVVAERPDWELVVSLSDRLQAEKLGRLPERAHAFAWVPQLELLRHADVAVTHGGIGTVDECVLAGVPMLVYCGFETDMAGTTARVVHHGIGIAGERSDATADIRRHLDLLLDEPRFAERVDRLRASYLAYARQRVAERAVEQLLGSPPAAATAPADRARPRPTGAGA